MSNRTIWLIFAYILILTTMEQKENNTTLCQPLNISELMPYIDILDEYFGLGALFFSPTIQYLHGMYYSEKKPIPEEMDTEILIPVYVQSEDVYSLLERAGLKRDNRRDYLVVMFTLYLLANLIYDREYEKGLQAVYESIGDETLQYRQVKKDLLKLYLFLNDPMTRLDRPVSIQHATGTVKLDNSFGWFTRRMLKGYLAEYLPDITSVEQAKEELESYKKRAGRKSADAREQVLIYGIYRMFHEQTEMKDDLPDRLCEFIFEYLKLIKVYDIEDTLDMSNMRPTIRHIIKKPEQPKFGFSGKMRRVTEEELKKIKTKLY